VRDCRIENCGTSPTVLVGHGAARFERTVFDSNNGAVWISQAYADPRAEFVECTFSNNSHVGQGGAIYTYFGTSGLVFERCSFLGNHCSGSGGAIFIGSWGPTPVIDGCRFEGNTAQRGGALYTSGGLSGPMAPTLQIVNSTFANNSATLEGGAVVVGQFATCALRNSILWGNTSPSGAQLRVFGTNSPAFCTVERCDVEGGQAGVPVGNGTLTWGAGNLAVDPLFADVDGPDDNAATFADNDYRLLLGSPCLDAGDNALTAFDVLDLDGDGDTSERVPFDLAGLPRFVDVPSAPDVGAGTPPLVDLGAYERP
jgi:predicted outer membrane repeat protein